MAILAIGTGIASLVSIASSDSETTTNIEDESKQQTQMMKDDRAQNTGLLNNINTQLSLLNALNEQQLSELEDANKLAPAGVNLNMGGSVHQSMDPSQSVLGGPK
jgi:hypothetical protein